MANFHTLSYTYTCEIPTLLYTWSLKKVPLQDDQAGGTVKVKCLAHKLNKMTLASAQSASETNWPTMYSLDL